MKGRLTYDQINAVVQDINKAVVSKYKILHQPLKSMNASVRSLYHRFLEEETKDTKGIFFFFAFISAKSIAGGSGGVGKYKITGPEVKWLVTADGFRAVASHFQEIVCPGTLVVGGVTYSKGVFKNIT